MEEEKWRSLAARPCRYIRNFLLPEGNENLVILCPSHFVKLVKIYLLKLVIVL
jgi:hypothetical protein